MVKQSASKDIFRKGKSYIELECSLNSRPAAIMEVLTARLLALGYEGFQDDDGILLAYVPAASFSEARLRELDILKKEKISYDFRLLEDKNWNREWEKNFSPVVIGDSCLIRAPFHQQSGRYPIEVIIEPKMAFGTGHHATTGMIAGHLLSRNLKGLFIFDMGCGSGILGIIAAKAGAAKVEMADNDPVAVESALENVSKNRVDNIKVYNGGAEVLREKKPDMIIANITLSVLIEQMEAYYAALAGGGTLVISGILKTDYERIVSSALLRGFEIRSRLCRQEWLMLEFCKPENQIP